MLGNVSDVLTIIVAMVTLTAMMISSIFTINRFFRELLDKKIIQHDNEIKQWISNCFEDYYLPLDDRIKNINNRVKDIENQLNK